jgi:hypothetical protein
MSTETTNEIVFAFCLPHTFQKDAVLKVGATAHSAELSEGRESTDLVQRSASRGIHIGARALLVI